jgi:hypothetical protein
MSGASALSSAKGGTMGIRIGVLGVLSSALVVGCTWVPLKPEAEAVRVAASADAVLGCKQIGQIKAHTKSSVGIFDRSDDTIRTELESLARNDAVGMGANAVLAEGPPNMDGEQKFMAYRCPKS